MVIRPAVPADAPAIARVHVDTWRTAYRGIIPADFLAQLSHERSESRAAEFLRAGAAQGLFAFVADRKDEGVVGFAYGCPERSGDAYYCGEMSAIYVLASHQGRGIGGRLMQAIAGELSARGLDSMLVWVLARNPARGFYEAMGGLPVRTRTVSIGGADLTEIAYGWPGTKALIQ